MGKTESSAETETEKGGETKLFSFWAVRWDQDSKSTVRSLPGMGNMGLIKGGHRGS